MAAAVDGTVAVDSGQAGVYGGTPPSVSRSPVTHMGRGTQCRRLVLLCGTFFVIHLDVVCVQETSCAPTVSSVSKRISALPHNFIWGFFVIKSCYDIHEDLVLKAHLFWFHVCVSIFKRKKTWKNRRHANFLSQHIALLWQVMALRLPF